MGSKQPSLMWTGEWYLTKRIAAKQFMTKVLTLISSVKIEPTVNLFHKYRNAHTHTHVCSKNISVELCRFSGN